MPRSRGMTLYQLPVMPTKVQVLLNSRQGGAFCKASVNKSLVIDALYESLMESGQL
jgi:hypothetical protein